MPLAWLLSVVTEDLALRTNDTIGGLLNATFGNAVELIISSVALSKGLVRLVQASLLGSILSNMLLVLGMSFIAGGIIHKEQSFNKKGAKVFTALLVIAAIAMVVPAAFSAVYNTGGLKAEHGYWTHSAYSTCSCSQRRQDYYRSSSCSVSLQQRHSPCCVLSL